MLALGPKTQNYNDNIQVMLAEFLWKHFFEFTKPQNKHLYSKFNTNISIRKK